MIELAPRTRTRSGKKVGKAKSEAKAASSRANGAKDDTPFLQSENNFF